MSVSIDHGRVRKVGRFLRDLPACAPTDWMFSGIPPFSDPHAIDFFFLAVKHQYGFWTDDGVRYLSPMYAKIGGENLKGSDFVWRGLFRSTCRDTSLFNIERMVGMSDRQILDVFSDDDGHCPLPMADTHCQLWREYARDMIRMNRTPSQIVDACRQTASPVDAMMDVLKGVGGYKEDPLAKKAALLTLILVNRPEKFLVPPEKFPLPLGVLPPIVDYHIQRSAIRIGLVRFDDPQLEKKIAARMLLTPEEESAVRTTVYEMMEELVKESGKDIDALDWFFMQNRRRCPEMTDPDCAACEVASVCPKRKDLFQPVIRTTFY